MTDVVDTRPRPRAVGQGAPRPDTATVDLLGRATVADLTGAPGRPRPVAGSSPSAAHAPSVGPAGHAVAHPIPAAAALDALAERWLTTEERDAADELGPRARAGRVAGRVAAKQAIAAHLAVLGFAEVAPARVQITNDAHGCPTVSVRSARIATRHLRVSIAHSGAVAVALASTARHPTTPGITGIGIDVEPIEARSSRFEQMTLAEDERRLAPVAGDDRDTWLTRLWAAKEAAAKATGLGLRGRPKRFAVTGVAGTRLRIAGRWIATERVELAGIAHIVATTDDHPTECSWHRS